MAKEEDISVESNPVNPIHRNSSSDDYEGQH